ncbi:MAG: hypothetical protein IJU18_00185 [Oscillospiraceae bacterium]|nr:hypothetical protein [Oscillospiraceae bacterium]
MYKIEKVIALTLGTQAQTVNIGGLGCLVENNSDSAAVYFKEKRDDGEDVTSANGWVLSPGGATVLPLTVRELSAAASAADTDARVLVLDEE